MTKECVSLQVDRKAKESIEPNNTFVRLPTSPYLNKVCIRTGVLRKGKNGLSNSVNDLPNLVRDMPNAIKELPNSVTNMPDSTNNRSDPIKTLTTAKTSGPMSFQQSTHLQSLQPISYNFSECSDKEIDMHLSPVHYSFSQVDETEFIFHEAQSLTELDSSFTNSLTYVFSESFSIVCFFSPVSFCHNGSY